MTGSRRLRLLSVVGARPQFIKAVVVGRALRRDHSEILVHTGQHYDALMSAIFFEQLAIPEPDVNLEVGSGPHGRQTGEMLSGLEQVLLAEEPDAMVVYGDTNSTLAGALAAAKLGIPVVHVEAGLRSFNQGMPEEVNRVLTDHVSTVLLCPSDTAVANLRREGISVGVHVVGDVMADALFATFATLERHPAVLGRMGIEEGAYLLATVHRAENTDNVDRLEGILEALGQAGRTVVFPVHPRTRKAMDRLGQGLAVPDSVKLVDPVGYRDMVALQRSAEMILTDSGGMQKEAYWLGTPCLTLRDETEWVETVEAGWNRLVGADPAIILEAIRTFKPPNERPHLYGDGKAAQRCVRAIEASLGGCR